METTRWVARSPRSFEDVKAENFGLTAPRCPSVDSTAAESDPGASTSSISAPPLSPQAGVADNQNTTRPTPSLVPLSLDNWFLRDGSPLASSSNVVTEQLRRSVLPASTPNDSSSERIAEAAAWQSTTTTTSIGGLSVDNDHHNSTDVDLSNTRISRSARASWYAAFNNDTQDFPDSSTMLPPRLGTPVPVATASSPATAAAITPANSLPASSHRTLERALEEGLTSTGRRALARHRLRTLEAERQNTTVGTVSSLDVRTIERAQAAVEASRIALEQARQAIRMALRDSES